MMMGSLVFQEKPHFQLLPAQHLRPGTRKKLLVPRLQSFSAGLTSQNHHQINQIKQKLFPSQNQIIFKAKESVTRPKVDDKEKDDLLEAFWDYQRLFTSQRCEVMDEIELKIVEGEIPKDLEGAYLLAGPGLFEDDHGSSVHPLDGHGYVRKFSIKPGPGSVLYSARYVDTEAKEEEYDKVTDSWRFTHRGPFSVLRAGKRLGNMKIMKNVANTSVVAWAGRLMCLWEGGHPYELHTNSLSTIGQTSLTEMKGEDLDRPVVNLEFEKVIQESAMKISSKLVQTILAGALRMPKERVLSHYKIDSARQRLVILTCESQDMLFPNTNFCFYEFDSSMKIVQRKSFVIREQTMVHDWSLTHNHYLIFANRVKLDVSIGCVAAICGLRPMISTIVTDPCEQGTPVYIFPRFSNTQKSKNPIYITQQPWVLHVANAYEEFNTDSQKLTINIQASVCSYKWFSFHKMFGYDSSKRLLDPGYMNAPPSEISTPHLVNISITLDEDSCCNCSMNIMSCWTKPCDFPTINPSFSAYKNKYMYAAGNSTKRRSLQHFPFDSIVKIDIESQIALSWQVKKRSFVGEPIFVPKQGAISEDEGYLIFIEYAVAEHKCYLVILDAKKLGKGRNGREALVAKAEVPRELFFPLGFHGYWMSPRCHPQPN